MDFSAWNRHIYITLHKNLSNQILWDRSYIGIFNSDKCSVMIFFLFLRLSQKCITKNYDIFTTARNADSIIKSKWIENAQNAFAQLS